MPRKKLVKLRTNRKVGQRHNPKALFSQFGTPLYTYQKDTIRVDHKKTKNHYHLIVTRERKGHGQHPYLVGHIKFRFDIKNKNKPHSHVSTEERHFEGKRSALDRHLRVLEKLKTKKKTKKAKKKSSNKKKK
jgi:hypothetical protein